MSRRVVLDSSVGVKWFREEAGTPDAVGLLCKHRDSAIEIVVASLFCYECVAVAARQGAPDRTRLVWQVISESGLTVVEIDDTLVAASIEECETLGCAFYDAVAPALARLLKAPLYSADRRGHEAVPGVVLIG
jgi:predicted nucleic acid-binding protein